MTFWDLSGEWELRGWRQNDWELGLTPERAKVSTPEIGPVPARVPGSVRGALLDASLVADPMVRQQSRLSEWIEHRHWTYRRALPIGIAGAIGDGRAILHCESLDYAGTVLVDETVIGEFTGTFTPHEFDITDAVCAGGSALSIVFTTVPDGLGQNGWTTRIRDFKPRFSYGWDWTPRIVQTGIAAGLSLEVRATASLHDTRITTAGSTVTVALPEGIEAEVTITTSAGELRQRGHGVLSLVVDNPRPWGVRPDGKQGLYTVRVVGLADGQSIERRVGFRTVEWRATDDAPVGAENWLCVVNGTPVFLAGVNWVPIRPDYADVTDAEYRSRLESYHAMGITLLRVWGGAGRERDAFYDLCDELGMLVWQELPLSSSGLDNEPPSDPEFIAEFTAIAASYALQLAHHPCLVMWSGGNELTAVTAPAVEGPPLDRTHPTLAAAEDALDVADPGRRFVATSPLGPRFDAHQSEFGHGLHHDVHGPWEFTGDLEQWRGYWTADDAIMRSEVGVSGASSINLLRRYDLLDASDKQALRQLWTHSSGWWLAEFDRDDTSDIAAWVDRSQERQAHMLEIAAQASLDRFPACAGFVVWLGHDTFPCAVSLALLDYDGAQKPAAKALGGVFAASPHVRSA